MSARQPRRPQSRRRRLQPVACLILTLGLGACADYLKHSDTVTIAAGDAKAWNSAVHTTDPWPPYVMNTRIESDGQRLTGVIERYSKGQPAPSGTSIDGKTADSPQKK